MLLGVSEWVCVCVCVCVCVRARTGVARIFNRGGKARERSDRAGGGCGRGIFPPTVGRFWKLVYKNEIFLHVKCH